MDHWGVVPAGLCQCIKAGWLRLPGCAIVSTVKSCPMEAADSAPADLPALLTMLVDFVGKWCTWSAVCSMLTGQHLVIASSPI